jgi:CRP/FNR family transcriptional regulator, cyclic AMP receptor protein
MSAFNLQASLRSNGTARAVEYRRGAVIFSQGEAGDDVMYIEKGGVRLSVRSKAGHEAVVATLGPHEFFAEDCLAGQSTRTARATAIAPSTVLLIDKRRMARLLRRQRAMADRFIAHELHRSRRMQESLLDHLFMSTEKRLACALLLAARYGLQNEPERVIPRISQAMLSEATGATSSEVRSLMSMFKKLRLIEDHGQLTIHRSLLGIILHDEEGDTAHRATSRRALAGTPRAKGAGGTRGDDAQCQETHRR